MAFSAVKGEAEEAVKAITVAGRMARTIEASRI